MFQSSNSRRAGFTMVEMLVVVGIIIILMGLLWPAVMKARRASRQTACAANLRQIGELMLLYANANDDHTPFGLPAVPLSAGAVDPNGSQWHAVANCYPVIYGVPSAGLGPLIANGMINRDNCKILYCPADADERLAWKLWRDKFPIPGQPPTNPPLTADVRISYFWRPVGGLWKHTLMQPPAVQCFWPDLLVRYDDLLNKATFAECAAWPSHGSPADPRINVLKQDGSVRSVMVPRLSTYPPRLPDMPNSVSTPEPQIQPSSDAPGAEVMLSLWESLFDKQ